MTLATPPRLAAWLLACAMTLLAACGGGSEAPPGTTGTPGAAAGDERLVAADAEALAGHFRARLAAAGTPTPAGTVSWALVSGAPAVATTLVAASQAAPDGTAGGEDLASPVLQEAGVDEDDVVRAADGIVYALTPPDPAGTSPQSLVVQRAAPGGAGSAPLAVLALDRSVRYTGLFLDASRRRVVAIGGAGSGGGFGETVPMLAPGGAFGPPTSTLAHVDVADPARPVRSATVSIDGALQAARVIDGRLWLVLQHQPRFAGIDWSGTPQALQANRSLAARLSASDVLPAWRVDGRDRGPLVPSDGCWLQPATPAGAGALTTVAAFELAAPGSAPTARCVAAPVETVYMTPSALYLATTRYASLGDGGLGPMTLRAASPTTDLHKFALGAGTIAYRGSGSAPGRLSWGSDTARFMLSDSAEDLRVVTQADPGTGASPARLTVLRDDGAGTLRTLASLPSERRPAAIGKPGEQVHAVRFVGTRAYVVTFRRTDPVYAIDLSDAADPRLLGALEVPGFSDRLVPLSDGLLLGVGHATRTVNGADVRTGVLVSLIDVRDPARPLELARRTIGATGSQSASDFTPHGLSVRRVGERWRIALPVTEHGVTAGAGEPSTQWSTFTRLAAHRFEIDPAAPALTARAELVAPQPAVAGGVRAYGTAAFDRAVPIGAAAEETWLWYDGRFVGAPW